jgi:hypothetical protein
MESRIIEALIDLGYNKDWLYGKVDNQTNNVQNNNGVVGIKGDDNTIVNKVGKLEKRIRKIEKSKGKCMPTWIYWVCNGFTNTAFNNFLFHCENGNYVKGLNALMLLIIKFNDNDINAKDYCANKAATYLEGKEIRMSSHDKAVIESLSGVSYPRESDVPEKLRKIINDIKTH